MDVQKTGPTQSNPYSLGQVINSIGLGCVQTKEKFMGLVGS